MIGYIPFFRKFRSMHSLVLYAAIVGALGSIVSGWAIADGALSIGRIGFLIGGSALVLVATLGPLDLVIGTSVFMTMAIAVHFIPYSLLYYARFVPLGLLVYRFVLDFGLRREEYQFAPPGFVWPFGALSALALASITYSEFTTITLQRSLTLGALVLVLSGPVWSRLQQLEDIQRILVVIVGLMAAFILLSLVWVFVQPDRALRRGGVGPPTLQGVFFNPNTLGATCSRVIPFLLWYLVRKERPVNPIILWCLLGLSFVAIVMTGSRAAFLGLLVSLVVYACLSRQRTMLLLAGGTLFISILAYIGASSFLGSLSLPILRPGIEDVTTVGRGAVWRRSIDLILARPWLGHGFGTNDQIIPAFSQELRQQDFFAGGPHNSVLSLAIDLGVIGVMLAYSGLLWIVIQGIRISRRLPRGNLPSLLTGVLVGQLVDAVFESWLFSVGSAHAQPFWFFVIALLAIVNLHPKSDHDYENEDGVGYLELLDLHYQGINLDRA